MDGIRGILRSREGDAGCVYRCSAILLAVDTQIVDDRRLLVVQLERRIEGTRDYKVEEVAETIEFIVRAVLEK